MSRSRNIKPGFFKNEDLAEISFECRLLFIGLWTMADREGILEDRPKRIKIELFPGDSVDVDADLNALASRGFVLRYEVEGVRYIQILNFLKHQNPHHQEAPSKLPKPGVIPKKPEITSEVAPKAIEPRSEPAPKQPGTNRADSLIPDSQNLLQPQGEIRHTPPATAPRDDFPVSEERLHAIRGLCIASRISVSDAKAALHVRQWASEGVTDEQLRDAIAVARGYKPHPESIGCAYLAPIVAKVRQGLAGPGNQDQAAVIARTIAKINAEESANVTH